MIIYLLKLNGYETVSSILYTILIIALSGLVNNNKIFMIKLRSSVNKILYDSKIQPENYVVFLECVLQFVFVVTSRSYYDL